MVVLFAVQFPIPEVAAGGEGLLTRRALQTLLVPGRLVDSHQEAVGDGPLAALADGGVRAVGACSARGESRAVSAGRRVPAAPAPGRGQLRSAARPPPAAPRAGAAAPARAASAVPPDPQPRARGVRGPGGPEGAALPPPPETRRSRFTRRRRGAARGGRVGPAQARRGWGLAGLHAPQWHSWSSVPNFPQITDFGGLGRHCSFRSSAP